MLRIRRLYVCSPGFANLLKLISFGLLVCKHPQSYGKSFREAKLFSLFAQIAQLVEQRTENPRVTGSIPVLGRKNDLSFLTNRFFIYYFLPFTLQFLPIT